MEFRILGPLEIADGERVLALGGLKRRAVAAALVLEANRVVASERLIDLVWGDEPPASARIASEPRAAPARELGDRVATRAPGYLLRVEPGELDLDRFRSLVDRARAARPAEATALLDEALALWRGEPLADLADEPVGAGATHLGELRLEAVELRNDAELALGRHAALLPGLETLVAAHPFRERFRAELLLALIAPAGRPTRSTPTQRRAARSSRSWAPSRGAELQELQRAILNQDASLAAPAGATLRTNLPVPTTAFLGREQELAGVVSLLCREDVRLLTLTGPGGTGKTRLALRAAAEVADDYPDGIWWVPLATLRDPQLVVETAAQAMGAAGNLAEHVADKIVLVLFDNFEQVVAAATAIGELLAACPKLKLLVTSREPLRLLAEQEYPVPSFTPADSVDFFIARARAASPDFCSRPGRD